jgi:spermidine/putrescine transport system permease protein
MSLFFLIPALAVFAISLRQSDPYGGIASSWSLEAWRAIFSSHYVHTLFLTLVLSIITTAGCIFLAVPTAYAIAIAPAKRRGWLLLAVIIPFWINFLIRIFAWKVLLHPEGTLKNILVFLHLIEANEILLYGPGAVLLVMIYSYLPFAILPVYAAAEKFDYTLLEAASDLGASRFQAFWKIYLPGIQRGIKSAIVMVLVPALGAYVIPDMVGGSGAEMISSKISQRAFIDRNLPEASALSALLTLLVFIPFLLSYLKPSKEAIKSTLEGV